MEAAIGGQLLKAVEEASLEEVSFAEIPTAVLEKFPYAPRAMSCPEVRKITQNATNRHNLHKYGFLC